ncbi:MAG: hypothetical protein LBQ80_00850 [Clostridium sp.]|jgi:Na+-translocating ferredoxin:NAD+ oxidoreductase RnfA subunit|nr:hypothetical protein [Clostridium sp.]
MSTIVKLVLIALSTVFVQNLVFKGGFGMGEAMRIATKPRRFLIFTGLLTGFCVADTVACALINKIPAIDSLGLEYQMPINSGILLILFLLVVLAFTLATKRLPDEKFLSTVGMAALNTLVFTLPILGKLSAYGIAEAAAFGVGAGISFLLALSVLRFGVNKILENQEQIPHAFRGTPAFFIYSALFSLAMVGLAGETLF